MARSLAGVLALALAAAAASQAAAQTPFTSSFTTGSNWNSIYAQGFSPMQDANPDPGLAATDTVELDRFQFFKSGNVDDASNFKLAIVSNYFVNLETLTTSSPELMGLSTNTIATTSTLATGAAISFNFASAPLTYGNDYAAIFVTENEGALAPVLVAAMIADYAETSPGSGEYRPTADYGDPDVDYFKSTSNFLNVDQFGTYLVTFNAPYADATFIAYFNQADAPIPGDYDGSGRVDGLDVATWVGQFGQTGAGLSADGNGDQSVDGADVLFVQQRLGDGNATAALSAAPEPASWLLSVVAAACARRPRRRPAEA